MDNRLDQNRLLRVLENCEDKKYFYASLMFCKLAENIWLDEISEFSILHGYSHLKRVIINQEKLLDKFSDDQILDLLDEKFIFLLLSATYCHDFGMKEYYSHVYTELENTPYSNLNINDKIKIRNNHHDIIDTVLSKLVDEKSLKDFFGTSILQYFDMILSENHALIEQIKKLIISNGRKIGLIAKYHNQPLENLGPLISRLQSQRKLHLNTDEEEMLKLISAILQFSDGLDMSISRVDMNKFIDFLKDINSIDYLQYKLIEKSLRCYMIDEIRSEYESINSYKIEFYMSLSEKDLEEHYEYTDYLKKEYEARLNRNDHDCLKLIEKNFGFTTKIICSSQEVKINDLKFKLPEYIFKIHDLKIENMKGFFEEKIKALSSKAVFSFFKFFSNTTNVFYGGYCYFHCKTNLEEKELDFKQYIEKLIFYPLDWSLDMKKNYDYSKICEIKNFGLIKRNTLEQYKTYLRFYKSTNIKSELHFPLKYKNLRIGFVKLHYDSELNAKELKTELTNLESRLSTIGIEIQNIFHNSIIDAYNQAIREANYLSSTNKTDLLSLFNSLFELNPSSKNHGRFHYISEIKRELDLLPNSIDKNYNIFINKEILKKFYYESHKYNSDAFGKVQWSINIHHPIRIVSIQCKLTSNPSYFNIVRSEFIEALRVLEEDFPSYVNNGNYRIARYIIPLKCFVFSFGGKIHGELINNMKTLIIEMNFPIFLNIN